MNTDAVVNTLNKIMEHELSGVVRYTHYSLMVYGYNRIPIVGWLRKNAQESLLHAQTAGEHLTTLDAHPSLKIADLLETQKHTVKDILAESLDHENAQLKLYYELLEHVEGKSVWLEEYARQMVQEEEMHQAEVRKMLRAPE